MFNEFNGIVNKKKRNFGASQYILNRLPLLNCKKKTTIQASKKEQITVRVRDAQKRGTMLLSSE